MSIMTKGVFMNNWYRESKKKSDVEEFAYGDEIRALWQNMLNKEQDRSNIHFDLENDDGYDVKTKDLSFTAHDGEKQFRIKARICWAGGDWESPVCYFRCQYEDRGFYDRDKSWGNWSPFVKTIIIPEKNNANLKKGEKGLVAKEAEEGAGSKDIDEKALWDEMIKIAEKRLKQYWDAYTDYEGKSGFENTGCVRELTGIYK